MDNAPVPKEDAFAAIAEEILAGVEKDQKGVWRMPWAGIAHRPTNPFTGRPFSGSNSIVLWAAAKARGYKSRYWASPKAWARNGGTIRNPEAGVAVWMPVFDTDRRIPWTRRLGPIGADPDDPHGNPIIGFRKWLVWNREEVVGANVPELGTPSSFEIIASAKRLVDGYLANGGPALVLGDGNAYYVPRFDRIHMPRPQAFQSQNGLDANQFFYGVLLHEAIHSTGSKNRLARPSAVARGSPAYAKEELVAELGSAFLGAEIGLAPALRACHADYVRSWISSLRNRREAFFSAVRDASRAAEFVLDRAGWGRASDQAA